MFTRSTGNCAGGTTARNIFDSMRLAGGILRATTSTHTDAFHCRIVCDLEPERMIPPSQDHCSSRLSTYDIWPSSSLSVKHTDDLSRPGFIATVRTVNSTASHFHQTISNCPRRRFCRDILPIYRCQDGRTTCSNQCQNPRMRPKLRLENDNSESDAISVSSTSCTTETSHMLELQCVSKWGDSSCKV